MFDIDFGAQALPGPNMRRQHRPDAPDLRHLGK